MQTFKRSAVCHSDRISFKDLKNQKNYVNPFSFGGGLVNGGLSKDAMSLLKPIFSFDYMGSAEFEFGELPKCFRRIAQKGKEWICDEVSNKFSVKTSFKNYSKMSGEATIYIYAPKDKMDDIKDYIKKAIKDEYCVHLKEGLRLHNSCLESLNDKDVRIRGWVDIENDYFFFIDKEMRDKTANLFDSVRNSITEENEKEIENA